MRSFFKVSGFITAFALMFELSCFTAYKVNHILDGTRDYPGPMERSGLYKEIDLNKYYEENKAFMKAYTFDSFRGHRLGSGFRGEIINTDNLGRRHTKGQFEPKTNKEITIGVFGGSTLMGIGAESDLHTIPSLLFSELNNEKRKYFFRVFNYGVGAYNLTQEMIYLIESIRNQKFDIVIFYDFVNESLHGFPRHDWSLDLFRGR